MPPMSNYTDFANGVTIRGMPVLNSYPGKVVWVDSVLGSNGYPGTFARPFSTLAYAILAANGKVTSGDIIMIKAGHAETITASTLINTAGVAVIGLGAGTVRPTFTYTTAAAAALTVSVANVSFYNCVFRANFLGITSAFTLTTAAEFSVEKCYFYDTSSILNFLNIVRSTGAANTVDGLTFNYNVVKNLGVTSNNTTILTANDIDRLKMKGNYLKWAVQNDVAIGVIVTAGVLTNADIGDNRGYRPNTTTAGGSFINVGGTTSTGVVYRNYIQTLTTATDLLFTTTVGLAAFENYVTGAVGASGFIIPARDT